MSIIVRGMEMPEKCGLCNLFHAEYPTYCTALVGKRKSVVAPYGMPRPNWCPLVEIKTPHGDLIDKDVLMDIFADRLVKVSERYGINSAVVGAVSGAMKLLDLQPTVVEAEGEE